MYVGTVHHIVFTCILIFILKVKGEGEGNIFCNIDVLYHLVHHPYPILTLPFASSFETHQNKLHHHHLCHTPELTMQHHSCCHQTLNVNQKH